MANPNIFPFLPLNANAPPAVFPYDVVIDEAYPGIKFIPAEPNGEYQAIREVNGCQWFVTNADFNENTLSWEQNSPQNPALPAYALELCGNGHLTRYESPATTIPGTPITWVPLFDIDGNGIITKTPLAITQTATAEISTQIWDPGTSIVVNARTISIIDTASNSNSTIDSVSVNGMPVWVIRKDGTLIVGKIPFSQIIFPNPVEFPGDVVVDGNLTVKKDETVGGSLSVTGPINANGGIVGPGGTSLGDLPSYTTSPAIVPAFLSSVTLSIQSTHGFPVGASVTVSGGTGPSVFTFSGTVLANNGEPSTSITVSCASNQIGSPGMTIPTGSIVTPGTSFFLTNADNSIVLAPKNGSTYIGYDISNLVSYPPLTKNTGGPVVPTIGGSVVLHVQPNAAFPTGTSVFVSSAINGGFFGVVTSFTSNANNTVESYTIKATGYNGTTIANDPIATGSPITYYVGNSTNGPQSGSTSTGAAVAGVAFYQQRQNYGTQETPFNAASDDRYYPQGSFLGAATIVGISSIGQAIQVEFGLIVNGTSPLTIGGQFISNAQHFIVGLDSLTVATFAASTTTRSWSATVPADGAEHYLILHFDNNNQILATLGAFLPVNPSGGIDGSKLLYVGLPRTAYPH